MTVWFLREIHPLAESFLFTEMDSEICTGTSARNIKHTQKNFESEFDWGSLFALHLSQIMREAMASIPNNRRFND